MRVRVHLLLQTLDALDRHRLDLVRVRDRDRVRVRDRARVRWVH